jgi:hypothetical protein
MTKALAIALTLVVAALAGPTLAGAGDTAAAKTYKLGATMNARGVVTPKNKPWKVPAAASKAKGTFTGKLNSVTGKLSWRITYSGVGNPALSIADIHSGAPGKFGPILVRLCAHCTSGQTGVVKVKASAQKDIAAGNSWVTVITEKYPNGVIRGQIKVG